MDNLLDSHRARMIFITLLLCSGSLVVCEVIDPLIASDSLIYADIQGGSIQQSHLDEHDDEFVLIEQPDKNGMIGRLSEIGSAQFLEASFNLAPQLPPPKAKKS